MATLTIQKITKTYKNRNIINKINLYVTSGEVIGLLGPNGSGKTTIFYIILGITQHNSGNIFLNSTNISTLPIYRRAQLGINYLPQESSIFRNLTVFNNLMATLEMQHTLNKIERIRFVTTLMDKFHIRHLQNNIGRTLSGGERKRVEIARALTTNPKFILLDEPFAGVDPISITDIQKMIKKLQIHNLGILITDHNVRETLRICNRAYILNQGTLIADGSPQEILQNKHVQEVYLGNLYKI